MRSLPFTSINSGFLPYWLGRFSLLHHIATRTSPKHTSSIPSSCLSPLCYSLHKYLDTHSHQQNLPLIRWWFSICCLTFHWIFCCFPPITKTSQLHRFKIVLSCFLVALWLILQDSKVFWVAWKKCLDHFPCYFRRKSSFTFTSFIVFTCCFLITHLIFMLTYNPLLTTVKEHCDERNTNLWKH